ncbi:MAG: hypothetical protein MMC33_006750 [Icmadophila ericetorum]|nr:hypothetical protein [Icmadophila ericetorum]
MAVATTPQTLPVTNPTNGEVKSPGAPFSNAVAYEANVQNSSDTAAFKDLSIQSQPPSQSTTDAMNIDCVAPSKGLPQMDGDAHTLEQPFSSSDPTEISRNGESSPASHPVNHIAQDESFTSQSSMVVDPPAVQQPISEVREPTKPIILQQVVQINEAKQQEDLAKDAELANGIADGTNLPIERHLEPASTSPVNDDAMDTSVPDADTSSHQQPEVPAEPAKSIELPHHLALTTNIMRPDLLPSLSPDRIMQDAPRSPGKMAREREDDEEDAPATKRTKTGDEGSQQPEFKVPEVPQQPSEPPKTEDASTTTQENGVNGASLTNGHSAAPSQPFTKPQYKYLLKGLQSLRRMKDAGPFNQPVDYVALAIPTYPDLIKNPMDLKTIEEKLKGSKYEFVEQYVADFDQVVQNSEIFNGLTHPVTISAHNIKASFEKQLSNLPALDVVEPTKEDKKKKATTPAASKPPPVRRESRSSVGGGTAKSPVAASPTQTFALGPQGVPLIRRDSTVNDGRPKREIHPPAPRDLPYANQKPKKKKFQLELRFCQEMVTEMKKAKHSLYGGPFMTPVDAVALNIPQYFKIIKKPMDMSTIEKKLTSGQYENAKEFEADVRLMFQNCYKFNPPENPVYAWGKQFEAVFDDKWSDKKEWIEAHAPTSGPQSPGSSPEPEDESSEDSEVDDHNEQLMILQKQIAAMSKQVEMIQKKKASPPVTSRSKGAKAAKPVKKETKKAAAAPVKSEKKARPAKKEKIPYVTYEQKQDISYRINSLPENRMATALQIIRDNMPNLRGVQEDEIELDIDELSNEVLYKLLGFVRKYAPRPNDSPPPARAAPSAPAANSRPKKSKPMSKNEQEAKIQEIKGKLSGFQNPGSESSEPERHSKPADDTSGDEDDSEESEED